MHKALVFAFLAGLSAPAFAAPDGKTVFQRCAACHLPTGAGVPGAYPPLTSEPRILASSPDGRRYLVLAVSKGLAGPLSVGGKTFRGVMPAQAGLDDASITAVLNYVIGPLTKVGPAAKPFTAAEVADLHNAGSAATPTDLAKLHERLAGK